MDALPFPPLDADEPAPQARESAARRARNLAMLDELAALGMRIARKLGEKAAEELEAAPAAAAEPGPAAGEPGRAEAGFARAAQTVRQILALQNAIEAGTAARRAAEPEARVRRPADPARVEKLRADLDRAIEREPEDRGLRRVSRDVKTHLAAGTLDAEMADRMHRAFVRELPTYLLDELIAQMSEDAAADEADEADESWPEVRGPDPP